MAERKAKRNSRRSKRGGDFRVCSEPIARVAGNVRSPDASNVVDLPRSYGRPVLFAIARDAHTIFVSWNIDWRSIFQKGMPADRQVYLRVVGDDGSERKRLVVEPMLGLHCLTTAGLDNPHRIEIGYYQPRDAWHSVAISNEIERPLEGSPEIDEDDVVTIPLHLSFQQLANLFETANDTPLANVVSRFQNCALNTRPNELSPTARQILRKLNLSLPAMADARRDFEKSDTAKLVRRKRALLQFVGTSPSRGFERNTGS